MNRTRVPALVACVLTGVQALVVAAVVVFYGVELSRGEGADDAGVVSSLVLFVVVAGALGAMASGWWRGATWPRTATLVWNLVLAPVAVALVQADQVVLGLTLAAVVVAALAAALAARADPASAAPGDDGTDLY